MNETIHVISLGAGVQSSTMALMAAAGEITPMPQFAVFADTGDEPRVVYEWLDKLERLLPFKIHKCKRSVLSEHLHEWGHSQIPAFTLDENGNASLGKRQCTYHWKIVPVQKECRRVTGTARKRLADGHFTIWQGISTDEAHRMKDSRVPWIKHRWPLIELRMSRGDCIEWLARKGYPKPPKSACVFCPFQGPKQWATHKRNGGSEWEKIKAVDAALAKTGEFLTSECKRIDECDFSTDVDKGQNLLWGNECEGMCGV